MGDDKQIAPYNVGINRDDVERLRSPHIPDLPLSDYFDLDHSFFDQAYLRFGNRIRLCEHFRCMPEIIQFSNNLCYNNEPLHPAAPVRRWPAGAGVVARHVPGEDGRGFAQRRQPRRGGCDRQADRQDGCRSGLQR